VIAPGALLDADDVLDALSVDALTVARDAVPAQ